MCQSRAGHCSREAPCGVPLQSQPCAPPLPSTAPLVGPKVHCALGHPLALSPSLPPVSPTEQDGAPREAAPAPAPAAPVCSFRSCAFVWRGAQALACKAALAVGAARGRAAAWGASPMPVGCSAHPPPGPRRDRPHTQASPEADPKGTSRAFPRGGSVGRGGQRAGSQEQARLGPDPRHRPRQRSGAFVTPRPVFSPAEGPGGSLPSRLAEGSGRECVCTSASVCVCRPCWHNRHQGPGLFRPHSDLGGRSWQGRPRVSVREGAGKGSGVESGRRPQQRVSRVSLPPGGGPAARLQPLAPTGAVGGRPRPGLRGLGPGGLCRGPGS